MNLGEIWDNAVNGADKVLSSAGQLYGTYNKYTAPTEERKALEKRNREIELERAMLESEKSIARAQENASLWNKLMTMEIPESVKTVGKIVGLTGAGIALYKMLDD